MNTQFQDLIPKDFNEQSRVWVYQSNRPFNTQEVLELDDQLKSFVTEWLSHGDAVKGFGKVLFDHFIVIMADEGDTAVGGCSTDSSQRFIKNLEKDYSIELFNRQMMAFIVQERVQLIPLAKINEAIARDIIGEDTLYFNNTILTKRELMNSWIILLKDSWLAGRLPQFTPIQK